MEHKGHIEQDDNVYGSEATDEAYMDAEAKANADVNMKAKVFFILSLYMYIHTHLYVCKHVYLQFCWCLNYRNWRV